MKRKSIRKNHNENFISQNQNELSLKRTSAITDKRKIIQNKLKIFSVRSGLDLPLFFITIVLLIIGLVMLFSASAPNAYYFKNGDSYYFIKSQLIWAVLGVVSMISISYLDYHFPYNQHHIQVSLLEFQFLKIDYLHFLPKFDLQYIQE